jgi:phage gp45-like
MVQRHTPLAAVFRGYTAGGGRAMIDAADDSKQMQEHTNTQVMNGESHPTMESPQNYGFTSVVADADKEGGKIKDCAESFVSYMGGNRNFPVMGNTDDRRHRLLDLAKDAAKGATAMFGLKTWGQQLLNTADGWYMTGNTKNKNRFALVDNKNDQQQQPQQQSGGGGPSAQVTAANGGGNGGSAASSGSQQQQQKGQKTLHKEDSTIWIEQNKTDTQCTHGDANSRQRASSDSTVFYGTDNSCQATEGHAHIMGDQVHIWVAGACYADMPIIIKKDGLCKNR